MFLKFNFTIKKHLIRESRVNFYVLPPISPSPNDGRYVFVVPTMATEEENEDIIEESEEFIDILQTDIKLSDSHAHSKQVIYYDMHAGVFSLFTFSSSPASSSPTSSAAASATVSYCSMMFSSTPRS